MPETKVSLLEKHLSSRGKISLFAFNPEAPDLKATAMRDSLTDHGHLGATVLQVEGVDLYSAFLGFMRENKAGYSSYGELPEKYMVRIEEEAYKKKAQEFVGKIKAYHALESEIHSEETDKQLAKFKQYLVDLASKKK